MMGSEDGVRPSIIGKTSAKRPATETSVPQEQEAEISDALADPFKGLGRFLLRLPTNKWFYHHVPDM